MTHVPQGENAPYNEHYHFFHGLNCGFAFIPTLLHTHTHARTHTHPGTHPWTHPCTHKHKEKNTTSNVFCILKKS